MIRFLLTACLMLSFGISSAQLKPEDVKTFTLKNGMKFLVVEDFSIPNANMYLFFKVGSRNEYQGITGLSHFFEHMMFNGAKKYGPKMFDQTMEFHGGANNAYTTNDLTVYTDWFPASALEVIFDLESDRIKDLTIDPAMVESERGVVLSERSTGLENSPWRIVFQTLNGIAFQEHPYHWPVMGYEDDMKNWKQSDLERYFKTYYAPNNCVVVISGAVKLQQVKQLAEKYFEPIPSQPKPADVHIKEPEQTGERRAVVQKDIASPYMAIGYHVPACSNEDYYPLSLLSDILTDGKSSRMYKTLVQDKALATMVSSGVDESFDPSLFSIYTVAVNDEKVEELENNIYQLIQEIATNGVTAEELQKVKNKREMNFYEQIATINGKSNNLGTYEVFFGDYKKMFDAPTLFQKVTSDDIKRVAAQYLKKRNRNVVIMQKNVD
jgi:predicted Zn-dependent peptidase